MKRFINIVAKVVSPVVQKCINTVIPSTGLYTNFYTSNKVRFYTKDLQKLKVQ